MAPLLLILCLLFACLFMVWIPVDNLLLGKGYPAMIRGDQLIVWHDRSTMEWRWLLVAAALLLSILSFGVIRTALSRGAADAANGRHLGWIQRLWPICLLPLGAGARLLGDVLPPSLVTNIAFYLPVAVLAAILAPGWPSPASGPVPAGVERRRHLAIVLTATLVFYTLGWYLAVRTGEHAGDEGHYLIQAESLYFDHDLDIENQIRKSDVETQRRYSEEAREYQHVALNSRDGHWYSWHSYGLPLILAPLWKKGIDIRYLILAGIAALGCLGMFRLSRRVGAGPLASVVAMAGLGGSCYWAIYSARALPEVLGATLLVWLFWAVRAQDDRPWLATGVAAACCVYLPPAHLRFVPMSLTGMGFFGLFGLFSRQPWPAKLIRLAVFTLLCGSGYAAFLVVQHRMFVGSSYPVSEVLFSRPVAMWFTIADVDGLLTVFPLFMWMSAAMIVWLVLDRTQRGFGVSLLLTFLACLITSCTNRASLGGACLPGRYLLVVMPLLVPAAAVMLQRSSSWARGWFLFLGLTSTMLLIQAVILVPDIGRGFAKPISSLRSSPAWQGLFQPHSSFIEATVHLFATHWTTLYVIVGAAASGLLMFRPRLTRRRAVATLGAVLAVGVISHNIQTEDVPRGLRPGEVVHKLLELPPDRVVAIRSDAAPSIRLSMLQVGVDRSSIPTDLPSRPSEAWRYPDPSVWVAGHDAKGNSCREALTDAVIDTRWSADVGTTNFPALTFVSDRPVSLCGIRCLSPNDRFPREVMIEGQRRDGERWETILPPTPATAYFWSGRQTVWDGVQFFREWRFPAAAEGVERVRVTFRTGDNPHEVCLGELLFMEQAPPEDDLPSFDACLAALRMAGVRQFYGPRWVSDRLALAVTDESTLQVPSLVPDTAEAWAAYDPARPRPVWLGDRTGFMMDVRDAERSRALLRFRGLRCEETPLGSYVLLVVSKPDRADDVACYPTLYWTEMGCFGADMRRFTSRKAHALYEQAVQRRGSGDREGMVEMLQKALDVCPSHEPARLALIEALREEGRIERAAANEAILKAQTTPQVPARIRFSGGIEFLGLALSTQAVKPNGSLEITYFWRCPPSAESTRPAVFVHFVQGKNLCFLDEHKLLSERLSYDLRRQPFNEILTERRSVEVPPTVLPGKYEITIGLYNPKNKRRLRAVTDLPERRDEVRLPAVLQVGPGS